MNDFDYCLVNREPLPWDQPDLNKPNGRCYLQGCPNRKRQISAFCSKECRHAWLDQLGAEEVALPPVGQLKLGVDNV